MKTVMAQGSHRQPYWLTPLEVLEDLSLAISYHQILDTLPAKVLPLGVETDEGH